MNQKGISSIVIILIIVGVLVVGGGVWYWQSQKEKEGQKPEEVITDETADWKTYRNEKYGFEIRYPSEIYTINAFGPEPKEDPNADTVAFFKTAGLDSPEPLATVVIGVSPNPQELSPENYLKQNYQKWLGIPSNYSDFYINEPTTFNGLSARKVGTERDQYIFVTKGKFIFAISTGDPELIKTFKFTR